MGGRTTHARRSTTSRGTPHGTRGKSRRPRQLVRFRSTRLSRRDRYSAIPAASHPPVCHHALNSGRGSTVPPPPETPPPAPPDRYECPRGDVEIHSLPPGLVASAATPSAAARRRALKKGLTGCGCGFGWGGKRGGNSTGGSGRRRAPASGNPDRRPDCFRGGRVIVVHCNRARGLGRGGRLGRRQRRARGGIQHHHRFVNQLTARVGRAPPRHQPPLAHPLVI